MFFIVLDLRLTKKIGCLGEIAFFMRKSQRKQQRKSRNNRVVVEEEEENKQKRKKQKEPLPSERPGKAKGWENKNEREYVKLLLINLFRRQAPDTN